MTMIPNEDQKKFDKILKNQKINGMTREQKELYDKFVDFALSNEDWRKWQTQMAIEEATEFILALLHFARGKGNKEEIISEIADLENMIGQMKKMHDISDEEIANERIRKVERTIKKHNLKL